MVGRNNARTSTPIYLAISLLAILHPHKSLRANALPTSPVISVSESLPGFQSWRVVVTVEQNYAYRLNWTSNLNEGLSQGSDLKWENLGHELSLNVNLPRNRPAFFRIDYIRAYAPEVVSPKVFGLLLEEIDDDLTISPPNDENIFNAQSTELEEGFEITFFSQIVYERTYINSAKIWFRLGTVSIREIATNEVIQLSIRHLAELGETVLPFQLIGEIEYSGANSGSINFKTLFTNNSEGEFKTVTF